MRLKSWTRPSRAAERERTSRSTLGEPRRTRRELLSHTLAVALLASAALSPYGGAKAAERVSLLNVSYDPTRELFRDFNEKFAAHWREKTGQIVTVQMSHAGSGSQARSVIEGLPADVVTLALSGDIDAIQAKSHRLAPDWQSRLPHGSAPYTSTIVFLVRHGNPKNIRDWDDLVRPDVQVVTPNPKTSGGARWNFLAAWGYVLARELGGVDRIANAPAPDLGKAEGAARAYVHELFSKHVPVLDPGARGATNTFIQRRIGDVLLAWENEALLAREEMGANAFDIVVPSVSILAEPTVAVVDTVVDRKGTRAVAEAYLKYLYTPAGQDVIARHYYRPRDPSVLQRYASQYPEVKLFTIDDAFKGWSKAQAQFFDDGGVFDQIYAPGAKRR
ncbi:MAG TPA: sulfate ABC transporter substrate-binding protein [Gammaproteobacteria bacterium]|nr:sulfate ABC transporter substrate-binding protein [Gammaproteobacteria bacterium]